MHKVFFILLMISWKSLPSTIRDFTNLHQALLALPEEVMNDNNNNDWEDPVYLTYYKSLKPSLAERTLQWLNLVPQHPWDVQNITSLLKNAVENRKKFIEKGAYATHIMAKPDTKFVIWGDLFGAVHSLWRDLEYFRRIGVLDEQLRIINPDYYFVFLGNVIDRSPYSLEILQVILILMERNPKQVLYLKGLHETDNYWGNFGLQREIKYHLEEHNLINKKEVNSFKKLLTDFFASLPGALYITQKDSTQNFICLSNDLDNYEISSNYLERFFTNDIGSIDYITVSHQKQGMHYNILALIKGGEEIKTPVGSNGLVMLEPYKGATVWSVLSCPTSIYAKFFDIHNDAFVILTIRQNSTQADLQLFYQDTRNKQGFRTQKPVNIITGEYLYTAAKDATYVIGSTMPLTKGLPYMGQDIKFSLFNLINESNQNNRLDGKFIRLTILDDEYAPSLAIKNIEKFIENDIRTILLPVGSPTLEAYLNFVKEGKITVLFPVTGSPEFRKPEIKNIINWRASYADEARALIEYMITENAIKKFAFFYQNDSYGQGPLEAAHALLKEKGITDWVDIPYNKAGINFDDAVMAIRKAQPDAIGLFSIPSATEELFKKLGVELLFNKKLFGVSFIADDSFKNFLKSHNIKVLFAQVVPNPETSDLEIVKEFRAFMDKHNHAYDVFALEGYITTQLYLEALKSSKGRATRENILAYFESYKDFSYKGLTMTFNPQYRDLKQSVWLEINEDTWKEYKINH